MSSTAPSLSRIATQRIEGMLRCQSGSIKAGNVRVIAFQERANQFEAKVEQAGEEIGFRGVLRVPKEWRQPVKISKAPPSPPPQCWSPSEAIWKLKPSIIERIEACYKMPLGAVGGGEIRLRAFDTIREGLFRASIYIPATSFSGAIISPFEPLPRRQTEDPLDAEDMVSLVRVFGTLLRWDREARELRGGK